MANCVRIYKYLTFNYVILALLLLELELFAQEVKITETEDFVEDNRIDTYRDISCGTIATNISNLILKNPNYPQPTFTKAICETVVEKSNPSVKRLNIKLKQLELYRPTSDGQCIHDRFAVYTDLNAPVSSVICGNQTGNRLEVPFEDKQSSLIISVITSDLDHDRYWIVEVLQES